MMFSYRWTCSRDEETLESFCVNSSQAPDKVTLLITHKVLAKSEFST